MTRAYTLILLCPALSLGLFGQNNFQTGTVRFDSNGNGVYEQSDAPLPGWGVRSGPTGRIVSTDYMGEYYFYDTITAAHTDTIAVIGLTALGAWSVPSERVISVPAGITYYDSSLHFLVQLPPGVIDASGHFMLPWPAPVPGREQHIGLHVTNTATTVADITAEFLGDTVQSWVSCYPPPVTQTGTNATWSFPAMQPMQDTMINIVLYTDTSVLIGTPIHQTMSVSTPGDMQAYNDADTLDQTVVVSSDPNFKQVSPSLLSIEQGALGEEVSYAIHFQNTGTAPAQDIVVTDTLDARLDPASFWFIGSSHLCTWSITGNVLRFQFTYIQLPDSGANEPGSHGQVQFKIRTVGGQLPGEQIPNVANIYFDFNAPVITDACQLMVEIPEMVSSVSALGSRVFPNPATGSVVLEWRGAGALPSSVELLDALGRSERSYTILSPMEELSLEGLPSGMYVLLIREADGAGAQALRLLVERGGER